jgi:hypothetical protein
MDPAAIAGPLVLFALMTVVGLQLTPADFRRVLAVPRAVVGGTLGQILLLPLMTWALLSTLTLSPVFDEAHGRHGRTCYGGSRVLGPGSWVRGTKSF